MLKNIFKIFNKMPKYLIFIFSVLIIVIIGIIDLYVETVVSFSLFYIISIFLSAWFINKTNSLIISFVSAVSWFIVSLSDKNISSDFFSLLFNSFIMFIFYFLIAYLITSLKHQMNNNERMANHDFLTGLVNPRYFYELAQLEIDRSSRYNSIFSVAYIDLDNFKFINDHHGHLVGDALLRVFADIMKENLRKTDTIARVGGDEFVVLLPETNYTQAKSVINKIKVELEKKMIRRKWPVTMSIGLVTYKKTPISPDELIKVADEVMYSAKKDGKNTMKHYEYK